MTLGQRLTRLRNEKGLSQDALAEAIDVSRQSVSKWETDASIPDLDKLVKLSDFFEVSLDELVKGSAAPTAVPAPSGWRLWPQKLAALYQEKAHWIGWLLVVWGIHSLINSFQVLVYYYQQTDAESTLRWMKAMISSYILYALRLLLGLFIVLWGRRFSGRFRWYHLGWVLVIRGLFGRGGPMYMLLAGLLLYLPYYGADRMLEYFALWPDSLHEICLCFLGLALLLYGKHRQHTS